MASSVVERRQTLPILSQVLLRYAAGQLTITGTNLEVEWIGRVTEGISGDTMAVALPARKLLDIVKALPEAIPIRITLEEQKALLVSGRSRFTLLTLPAEEFPDFETTPGKVEFSIASQQLKWLLQRVHFSMAEDDARFYLNGTLLEAHQSRLRTVTTDGHRLSLAELDCHLPFEVPTQMRVILPRKPALELLRLLPDHDHPLSITLGANYLRVDDTTFTFTSKLVDARYPDYKRVIPEQLNRVVQLERDALRDVLQRVSILTNEKYQAVRLNLQAGSLSLSTNNPDQEAAEEEILLEFAGEPLQVAYNSTYLLEILGSLNAGTIRLSFAEANDSLLIEQPDNPGCLYVVMPMRL